MFFEGQTWCHWGQLCTLQPCVGMSTSCECSWKQDAWIADICRPTDHLHVQSTRRQLHSVSFLCCGMCAQKFWQNGNRQEGKTLKRQETKERKHFFFCKLICCIWGINPNMTNDQGLDAFMCRPKRDAAPFHNQIIEGSCPRAHHGHIFTGYCSN